ncbi:MAG: hypothetical protein EBV77_09305 [Gemmatimonadaceae bacterium]|nr:hypothetical protein [Gemmatimonadaceae bacterium]
MSVLSRACARVVAATVMVVLTACGGDPSSPNVPASVTVTASGSTTVTSGSAVQLTVTYRDTKGQVVNAPVVTWSSSDAAVASVANTGFVVAAKAGTATITATVSGTNGTIPITVSAGTAAKLVVTTQPAGARQRVPLTTQPVVEIRDAADNLVATSTVGVVVSASVGTVQGTTVVNAQNGVVRFTDIALLGVSGPRTLLFNSGLLTAGTSAPVDLPPGPPANITFVGTTPRLRSGLPAGSTAVVVQLRDQDNNTTAFAGRRIVAAVSGGPSAATVTNTTAISDAQGRAVFSALTVSGTAGTRTLTLTADSIATPVTTNFTLAGGAPVRIVIDRDLPSSVALGSLLFPGPLVRLVDDFGNLSEERGVTVRATSDGAVLQNAAANTDSLGRALFGGLQFTSGLGSRTVRFGADGLTGIVSRTLTVTPPDTSPQPASILTAKSAADTTERNIELATTTSALTPYLLARDAQGQSMTTAGVQWFARDASVAGVATTGRITGAAPGRTFVVAQATRSGVADSVLVFVPKSGTGPIVRATLPSYRVRTDTFSLTFEIVPRDGRALTAADLEITWPGNRAGVFSPFNATSFAALRNDVVVQQVDAQQSLRVTWASATPVSGPVQLVRIRAQVNQRGQGNQVVITLNQLLQGDLTDITSITSIFNPVVIIP